MEEVERLRLELAQFHDGVPQLQARIAELEAALRELILWRDTGQASGGVWERARKAFGKEPVNG